MGSKGFMRDSYVGGIGNASFIPDNTEYHPNQLITTEEEPSTEGDVIKRQPVSAAWNQFDEKKVGNQTDEDKIIRLTSSDDLKVTNINKTEEYNVGYLGLSILPWEDFVFNPRVFNELFYVESNSRITYDPDDVNTFFHGKNVMPPSVGDISENGKSWNIVVDKIEDLRKVRTWLTERCSVFGVTLLYKEKRFRKPERAPCLVMIDPSKGTIGDKLYTTITRAMDSLHNRRRFCVEINLNGCVERWCKRVLMTECDVTGGKLVITNGEEYLAMDETEDKVCCVVCFPVWLLQTGIYKLHRTVVYDDFKVTFDADDLFLHGAFQDARCQRRQIFTAAKDNSVFRTRCAGQTDMKTLKELGSFQFVCVKRYNKPDADEKFDESVLSRISEHNTTTFGELVQKRKEKVLMKEKKLADKGKTKSIRFIDTGDSLESNDKHESLYDQKDMDTDKFNQSYVRNRECDSLKETVNDTIDDGSDEENDASLRIPEVASVLCDNDGDSYTAVPDNTGSLFSPGAHHNLVAKENIIGVKTPFDEGDAGSTNNVFHFDNNEEDDSDSESSDESDSTVECSDNVGKDDLMNEMFKIEQTLPTLQNKSLHRPKDVSELKAGEANKRSKKKKSKDKPGVTKALKDLMKTTKAKKDVLPSTTDDRYQEVSSKVKREQLKKAYGKTSSLKSNKNNDIQASYKNNVIESNQDETSISDKTESQTPEKNKNSVSNKSIECFPIQTRNEDQMDSSDDVDEVVSFVPDDNGDRTQTDEAFGEKINRSSPEGGNDGGTRAQCFTEKDDTSSTDGEDVEIIYQSTRNQLVNNKATLCLQAEDNFGLIERVDNANSLKRFNVHDVEELSMFNAEDSANKTDGEKLTHASKSSTHAENTNRNEMFKKSNRPSVLAKLRSEKSNKQTTIPSVTKSLDIDMEMTDFDQEIEVSNDTVVQSMDTDLPLKLIPGKGTPKRPKRGTRQYNSNRKYLGAAVPPKHK